MKYIHVIRNGIDMAFSENQNQMIFWSKYYFNKNLKVSPKNSLKYWCKVQKDLIENTKLMQEDFYFLNFDKFCLNPSNGMKKLAEFLDIKMTSQQTEYLLSLVKPPKSIGRYKHQDLSVFNKDDIAYVEQLGFSIV